MRAVDLDGNGSREWIVSGYGDLKVLDNSGEVYWEHEARGGLSIAGTRDFNDDGFVDIVLREGERAVAMQAVPDPLWRSRPFQELESVILAPGGGVAVQANGELFEIDAKGKAKATGEKAPEGRTLGGRIKGPSGNVDLFKGRWDPRPLVDYDIDGDGNKDVVLPARRGLVAYDPTGKPLLRIRSHDVGVSAGVGDLDGRPGDEIVLAVQHYGLVVLGR
jgi:hypothetical protein